MKITAALFREPGQALSFEQLDLDAPREDEVLVRVVASGVCHTDLKATEPGGFNLPRPIVLGHEGAGIVEAVGSAVRKVAPGDHVVLTFDYCGNCSVCRRDHPAYCLGSRPRNFGGFRPDGSTTLSLDGTRVHGNFFGQSSFATHALASERNVVKVAPDLPLDMLAPLGCGVQTGAGAMLNVLAVRPGEQVAVFGTGAVGLAAVMAARVAGAARIIAIDVNPARRDLALELGATDVVDATAGNARDAVMALTGGGADVALDTSSLLPVIRQAIECLAPLGRAGVLASNSATPDANFSIGHLMGGGRRIHGIVEGDSSPDRFIPMLIDLWRQGRVPFDRLVRFYSFEQVNEAFHDAETGATVKPVLRMPG